MVTIYDIAKKCGVSGASVSKALNGHSDISEKTRARIQAAADELGYMPNMQARSLITKKSYSIGVLFVDDKFMHPFFGAILEYIRIELEGLGYDMVFISAQMKGIHGGYLEHCRYRGVDGVILVSVDFDDPEVKRLVDSEVPTVLIDKETENGSSIMSQNYEGTSKAVRYLIRCGHTDIGYVYGKEGSTPVTYKRLKGYRDTMKEQGLRVEETWVAEGEYYSPVKTYETVKEILSGECRPTALLLSDDYVALSCYQAARELGLRIPEDISFIGNDGLENGRMLSPVLTSVKQNMEELGRNAAREIIRLVENRTAKGRVISVETSLREGASVAVRDK